MKQITFLTIKGRFAFLLIALLAFTGMHAAPPPPTNPTYVVGDVNTTLSNDGFTYPAPYGNFFWGARHQFLVLASELTALGATSGNITAAYFNVAAIAGTPLTGFEIKIKSTATTDLTTWETGLSTVFTSTSYTEVQGWNQHGFLSPFFWDGTSNLIIETCFNNSSFDLNASTFYTTMGFNASVFYYQDASGTCTNFNQAFDSPSFNRPNIGFDISAALPCVAPPNPGSTVSDIADACAGETITLSLFGNSIGTGQTYQWQSSPDGVTYTDIVGATADFYTTTITQTTYFQCVITCSGQSASSLETIVNLLPLNQCYCDAGSTVCDEFISDVQIGPFTNPSGCGTNGYTDYTSLSIDMMQQTDYPITVQNGPPTYTADQCGIWVDWNQDGDFADADETITVTGTPGAGPYTALINPPAGSLLGSTRMRIRITYTGVVEPCGFPTYGEVEDYTINVLPAPSCPIPGGLTATNVSSSTADLDWNDVPAAGNGYMLRYKLVSDPITVPTWATPTPVAVSNYSLSGLMPTSTYEYQVESDCGSEQSGYSFSFNFTTGCAAADCPPSANIENEPCGSDANGGCNMTVPTYEPINCGESVCGTAWASGFTRDTDWYTFTLAQPSAVTITVDAEFTAIIGFVDANQGCAAPVFFNLTQNFNECAQTVTFDNLAAGTWWFFVGANVFDGYPCGSGKNRYVATLNCTPIVTAANDDCAGAISLTQNATCIFTPGNVDNATQSQVGCVGTANDDVWFSFVATGTSALVTVDGSNLFDAVIEVFDACGGNSIACIDGSLAGDVENALLNNVLTIGNTYYIRVYDFGLGIPSTTGFEICVSDAPDVIDITDGTANACSGLFYDSGISGDYQDNENYVFTLYPDVVGNFVGVQFNSFQLENGFDFLYIYDGTSTAAPLIGTYTDANSPGIVTATNIDGALTFLFTSDVSVPNPGWDASIFCVSPNDPPSCPVSYTPANNSTNVTVFTDLSWFNAGGGIPTGYDVYFGTSTPPPLVSTNQPLPTYDPGVLATNTTYYWQIIPTNANGAAIGCIINEFTTDPNVTVIMGGPNATTCTGIFYDSNQFGDYQVNENYTITISPDVAGNYVQVAFNSFSIENNFDFLTIYDGPTTGSPVIGTYTGTNSPGTVNSTAPGGELTFQFTSDFIINAPGWDATISCLTPTQPPTCVINATPADLSTNVNFTTLLTWTQGPGIPPTGYDVYFGTSTPPPLVSTNQSANSYDPGPLSFSTTYYWQVIPQNANGSATGCAIYSFTTAATVVYCPAGAQICDEFISSVDLNTISNTSACGTGGYTDYTAISTDLAQGLFYPITIGNGPPVYNGDQCGVWVDWNQDGDFDDAGEQQTITNTPGLGPYNGIVDVPPTALLGQTRMRVRITFTGAVDPCGITTFGEVEDYTINVIPAPACPYPGGIVITNVTNTSADIDWNDVPAALSYNVRYKLVSDLPTVPTWATPVNVLVSNYSVTGLIGDSLYEFQIESVCAPPDASGFSPSILFTTAPDPCPNTVCPSNALIENEACGSDANGGCNMTVPNYEAIACGDTICGTAWASGFTRDTDWFTFTLAQPSTVTWTVDADFPAIIGFVDASLGCAAPQFFNLTQNAGECSQAVTLDNLAAGTWWLFVATSVFDGYPCGNGRNNYVANLQCVPLVTAPNDDCAGAIMVTQNQICDPDTFNVNNATQSAQGCSGTANDDVWFSFVATSTNPIVEVAGSASFDPVIQVYTACGGTSLICEDASFVGGVEVAQLSGLTIGQTYYVRVYDFGLGIPATTDFTLCVYDTPPPPVNDDCAGAIPYVCGSPITANTSFANDEVGIATCGTSITGPGLWYTVTGNGGDITASLCTGTAYDSKINVFSGDCSNLVCVGGNDDFCGLQSSYTWTSTAGTTYYILVQGFGGAAGPFTLTVDFTLPTANVSPGADATLCAGATLNLSASLSDVTWSNGETTQNIVVSSGGDYSFMSTDLSGCMIYSDTVTVTVSPGPVVPTIAASGPTVFCSGNDVTLSVVTTDSLVWIPSLDTASSIVVTNTGFYSVIVIDAAGCTAVSQAVSVTVNPLPTAPVVTALGSTDVCTGGSLTLVSDIDGDLFWTTGENNDTITVGSSTSCYSVVYTDVNSCSATSNSICVTELTAPASTVSPSGTVNICGGGSTVLTASSGNSYMWSTGETTQSITTSSAGDYSVMVTYANGCSSTSDTATVNFYPAPTTPVITANGPTTFCQGGTVTLSTINAIAYQWSSGETTATIDVTASGTFTVTTTDANGCTATSQAEVITVNQTPTAAITAGGNTTFCSGGSVLLTSGASTGNQWSNGETSQSIVVNASGSYSVVVTSNGCSATSNTIQVSVNSNPSVAITLSGPPTVCGGGTVDLTATPAGLASYQWSNGPSTPTITVATAGTYSVSVVDQNGCTGTASQVISAGSSLTPFITIGGPTIICEGESVQLLSNYSTGNTWSNGETTEAILVTTTGNYSVTVTDPNGCSATSSSVGVIVNPLPTANFTSNAAVGGFTSFTNTSSDFTSSQWNFGDGTAFSNQTNPTHTYQGDGTFTVTLTVFNDCGSVTISQTVTIIGTGIEELGSGSVSIVPNPSDGFVTLNIQSATAKQLNMRILDATGRLVLEENLGQVAGEYRKNMDLSSFAKGIYLLQLISEEGSGTHRLIIE